MGQPTETIRTTALATTVSAATADAARRCIDRHGNAVAVPVFEWVARRLVATSVHGLMSRSHAETGG